MKSVQLARAVYKASSTPPSFLLPSFAVLSPQARTRLDHGSYIPQRLYSATRTNLAEKPSLSEFVDTAEAERVSTASDSSSSSKTGSSQEPGGSSENATAAPPGRRHSSNDISQQLASVYASQEGGRTTERGRARTQQQQQHQQQQRRQESYSLADRQGRLANALGYGSAGANSASNNFGSFGDAYGLVGSFSGGPTVMPPPLPVRLHAYVGRTEEVNGSRGLASAIRMMETRNRQNSVRVEVARQRFHERPGKKRKRLLQVRWRRRFRVGFLAMVDKVQHMRKMGW